MKTLIAAALLLALASPAHASKFRESDRKWLPVVDTFVREAYGCLRGWDEDELRKEVACKTMDELMEKLEDRGGYCYQGAGGIGRPGKRYRSSYRAEDGRVIVLPIRRHCYTIDWPEQH